MTVGRCKKAPARSPEPFALQAKPIGLCHYFIATSNGLLRLRKF
jgi:hypothetical protein